MSAERPGVVLIGGDFQGVGLLQSLGRRGIDVFLLDSEACIGRTSRYCRGFASCPPPGFEGGSRLAEALLSLADDAGLRGRLLLPNSDEGVEAVSRHKDVLEQAYMVPVPDWGTIRLFEEKRETYALAERLGIPAPRTSYPASRDELAEVALDFPLIVKPLRRDPFYALTRCKAVRADDWDELQRVWHWACRFVEPSQLMVQELVPGGVDVLYSLGCYFAEGRMKGHIVAHRLRQHPMDFGHATTLAETVDIPEIERLGVKLLSAAGYSGLAEVEFMFDTRESVYRLLEVNPRAWGWHTLAGAAGVDLPYLLYLDAIGEGAEDIEGFDKHVKWLRPITDVPTVVSEMLHGRMRLTAYVESLRGRKVLAPPLCRDDPLPFFAEFALAPYLYLKRGF